MSTLLPYLQTAAFAVLLIAFGLMWSYWRRDRARYLAVERWGISSGGTGTGVPTMVMEQDPPVEIRVGERSLFLRPLKLAWGKVFQKELIRFLATLGKQKLALAQVFGVDSIDDPARDFLADSLLKTISKEYPGAVRRLLSKTLLCDPFINPGRVRYKDLIESLDEGQLAEVVFIFLVYNCGGYIKKKILSLLDKAKTISPGMIATPFVRPWKQETETEADSSDSASPDTPSGSSPQPS